MKRVRLRATTLVLVMLCVMYFITYLDRVNISTAAAGFAKDFDLSKTQIGLVFSAFAYPYFLIQFVGGWFSDRFGAKRTLIGCGVLWASATIFTGLAGGLTSLLLARLLLGLGEGVTFPAATTVMAKWVPDHKRGFAQGITHAFSRIGNAVAPAVVVVIMASHGWRASFYVCGFISLVWVACWCWMFTERPADHPRITQAERDVLPPNRPKPPHVPWRSLFKRMLPVSAVYFCYGWTLWLFLSWLPQYFLHGFDLDLKKSAVFASSVFFAGVLGDTLGGFVTDRLLVRTRCLRRSRTWMVATCFLLTLISLLPLVYFHDVRVAVVCLAAGFFFNEMTIAPMWAVPTDIAASYSGTASAIMNAGAALAAIVSPFLGGYLIDRFNNWQLPFVCSMIVVLAGALLAFRMHPERRFQAPSGSSPAVEPQTL